MADEAEGSPASSEEPPPDPAPALDPADIERWEAIEEAAELLQIGEVDDALVALTRVAESEPDNEYAHFFLGATYFEREDYGRALKCYVQALERKPTYIGAMIGAGQSLRMLGDHERALRMGQEVLRLRKDDPDALYLVGLVHFQRDEKKAAQVALERFLATHPEAEVAMEVQGLLQALAEAEAADAGLGA